MVNTDEINSICFKCGTGKFGVLTRCGACNAIPRTKNDLALSLVLSEQLSSNTQLGVLAHELYNHQKLSISEDLLSKARKLLEVLGSKSPVLIPGSSRTRRQRSIHKSDLQQNPFALLGVTTRDGKRRIVELAEEKSLELDHKTCQKARSDLTSPRTRLSAEMAWLPGVSPRKASQLMSALLTNPMLIREESGLPTLAHLNLIAATFEAVDDNDSADDVAGFIREMVDLVDALSPSADQVLRDINKERSVSGFPEVRSVDQVEAELPERKRYYCNAIMDALDRLPTESLVDAMTAAVDGSARGGKDHALELIHDLVDRYEVKVQGFFKKEENNVEKLIEAAKKSAKSGESAVKPIVDKLDTVARNWDKVAQPIQLSKKVRGIDHKLSHEIAGSIRDLALYLFNEHDMLTQSQKLIGLIKELFAEVPEVSNWVEQDVEALADIFQNRKKAEAHQNRKKAEAHQNRKKAEAHQNRKKAEVQKKWAREITYRAEVGVIFKSTLSISPEGITWKNQCFPLDAVTRVRWGAVSVNGISTYTLAFGDNRSEAVVELKNRSIYLIFLEKLWRAVVIRLLTELLETLRAGAAVRFGKAVLRDDGVTLINYKFLRENEPVRCSWEQVHVWSADGTFYIEAKDNKKCYVGLSYIDMANTHVLEQAIRMALEKPGIRRLSDMLQ